MARDLQLAEQVVRVVLDEILDGTLGRALVEVGAFREALDRAVSEVADLLDPNELDDAFDDEAQPDIVQSIELAQEALLGDTYRLDDGCYPNSCPHR